MLYVSETWCLREKDLAILRRTKRAMVREMCGVKMMDRKNNDELIYMLELDETTGEISKANKVRWYGHVLKKEEIMMFYGRHWNLN